MLELKNIHKTYGKKQNKFTALKNINFTINSGETIAIVGKSGSGKSTLLHILSGLDKPSSGEILFENKDINKMKPAEVDKFRNQKFGFIFQQFFLNNQNTVLENVLLPLKIKGESSKIRQQKAMEAIKLVGLEDKIKNKAVDLSGGQKQRVCIARSLVNDPSIIFADEPTGNLDSENSKNIMDFLFNLSKTKGITLVIVTHDSELANMCQRQIHIKDGEILSQN
jgi:putative ABC transport system ATP-binding protein